MADPVDIANDLIESEMAARISRRPRPEHIAGTPECLYCALELSIAQRSRGARWCDSDCRDMWERRQRAEKQRPTPSHASED